MNAERTLTKKSELLNTLVTLKCNGCDQLRNVSLWDHFRGRKQQCACKDCCKGSSIVVDNDE